MLKRKPRIAIIHDYFRTYGGGERVVEQLHAIWPDAPIYTATFDHERMRPFQKRLTSMRITTSWAQKFSFFVKRPILYRLLLTFIWWSFNLDSYDVIISSSGTNNAKGIRKNRGQIHVCYCHTPPRYLYNLETERSWPNWLMVLASPFLTVLRKYDIWTAGGVDYFIANSYTVADRIKNWYKRSSIIIPPPNTAFDGHVKINKSLPKRYFLSVSRLVQPKHVDIIIKACNELGEHLVVVGGGPEKERLMSIAGSTIHFIGEVGDDAELAGYYAKSRALIIASQDEDFGITPLEAFSFGKPVIGYKSGGIAETITEGKTGVFFKKNTVNALKKALIVFNERAFSSALIKRYSSNAKPDIFRKKIKNFVVSCLSDSK